MGSSLLKGLSGHALLFNDSFYCTVRRGGPARTKCTSRSDSRPLPLSPRRRRPSSPRFSTVLCSLMPHFLMNFLASALGLVRWLGIRTVCWIFVPPHPDERTPIGLQQEWLYGLLPCRVSWMCATIQVAAFCAPHPHVTPDRERSRDQCEVGKQRARGSALGRVRGVTRATDFRLCSRP